jgi:hypothetical protein
MIVHKGEGVQQLSCASKLMEVKHKQPQTPFRGSIKPKSHQEVVLKLFYPALAVILPV